MRPSASRVYPSWQWQRKEPLSLKQCWLQTPGGWHSSRSSHVFESLLSWKPMGHVHWAPNGPWMQPWVQPALLSEQLSWSMRKQKHLHEWQWKEKACMKTQGILGTCLAQPLNGRSTRAGQYLYIYTFSLKLPKRCFLQMFYFMYLFTKNGRKNGRKHFNIQNESVWLLESYLPTQM